MCFEPLATFDQAPETELVFIDAPGRTQSNCGSARTVAIFESVREQSQKERELDKIISLTHCCQQNSEVADKFFTRLILKHGLDLRRVMPKK